MNGGKNSSGYPDPTATIAIGNVYREQRKEQRMNQSRKGKGYQTSRKVYKDVKRYDHQQFDDFCTLVYTEGWKDGVNAGKKSVPGVDIEEVIGAIRTVKGIGEKRLEQIRAEVEQLFTNGKEGR